MIVIVEKRKPDTAFASGILSVRLNRYIKQMHHDWTHSNYNMFVLLIPQRAFLNFGIQPSRQTILSRKQPNERLTQSMQIQVDMMWCTRFHLLHISFHMHMQG